MTTIEILRLGMIALTTLGIGCYLCLIDDDANQIVKRNSGKPLEK